jgi:hypothetical protein
MLARTFNSVDFPKPLWPISPSRSPYLQRHRNRGQSYDDDAVLFLALPLDQAAGRPVEQNFAQILLHGIDRKIDAGRSLPTTLTISSKTPADDRPRETVEHAAKL